MVLVPSGAFWRLLQRSCCWSLGGSQQLLRVPAGGFPLLPPSVVAHTNFLHMELSTCGDHSVLYCSHSEPPFSKGDFEVSCLFSFETGTLQTFGDLPLKNRILSLYFFRVFPDSRFYPISWDVQRAVLWC